ncbi:MAG: hypothetical protein ACP5XB_02710 [Isosphaeraceae bacterium]
MVSPMNSIQEGWLVGVDLAELAHDSWPRTALEDPSNRPVGFAPLEALFEHIQAWRRVGDP